jgi:alkanesulfonate monooxygenase SsuD/methylene tetrahydromethanopterin reductase-like flavin-dependent oxidoreductase (luciferase family)
MRLALNIGYGATAGGGEQVRLARHAEALGYSCVWAAEAYGTDAVTVLTWVAAHTERIDVGSAIMQIPARTPAMTAMTAATLDTLSHGRFRLGLGVSGPQVSEGWHGVRFDKPLSRQREYAQIVRTALARRTLAYEGEHFTLPLPDGPGKALKLMLRPYRDHLPLYLAAVGPRNLELTGEVADGWLGVFFAPEHAAASISPLQLVVGDDVARCAEAVKPYTALYVGGMGSRTQNFYHALAVRMGFADAAERIQDHYLDRRPREAAAAVPFELVDQTALVGPRERIAERLHAYAEAGVRTLSVAPHGDSDEQRCKVMSVVAEAMDGAGLA